MTELSKPTEIFDACGAYDFKNGGNAIAKGSKFGAWSDALSFLEWYGIPHMDGFGIIIIDDYKGNNVRKYNKIDGTPDINGEKKEICFERAAYIGLALGTVVTSVAMLIS